jgi:hypothetical protein
MSKVLSSGSCKCSARLRFADRLVDTVEVVRHKFLGSLIDYVLEGIDKLKAEQELKQKAYPR